MTTVDELRRALGNETAGGWIRAMDLIAHMLPFLVDRGRPTRAQVAASVVGQAGFDSWRDMIEAPTAEGGLGWNWSAWRAWRRAYSVVLNHPYLRELAPSPAQIVGVLNRGGTFPATAEDWLAAQQRHQAEIEQRRVQSLADAKRRADTERERADAAEAQVRALTEQLAAEQRRAGELETRLHEQTQKFGRAVERSRTLKTLIEAHNAKPWWRRMSRFSPLS